MAEDSKTTIIKASKEPFLRPEREYKVILAGNSGVGKTSLIQKVARGVFVPNHNVTMTGDFSTIYYTLNGVKTKLQLWDTCGLEKYRSTSRIFFRGAHAAFVMFDTTDQFSLSACQDWIREVRDLASSSVVIYLVGSKIDLPNRKVTLEMAQQFVLTHNLVSAHFVSAKTHENVDALMTALKLALHSTIVPTIDFIYPRPELAPSGSRPRSGCSC
jgi:small GTP-binding protein